MSIIKKTEWNAFIKKFPNAHILQSSEWGEFKSRFGWNELKVQVGNSGAQILFKILPLGFSIAYIPKGPIGPISDKLLDEITNCCNNEKALVLYLEPDCWDDEFDSQILLDHDFAISEMSIQPRKTILVSLEGDEKKWLERMKQKTRYNIRLAQKKGIVVEISKDIASFISLMKLTSERDEFGAHADDYYQSVFEKFSEKKRCEILIAKYQENSLAAIMIFFSGNRAWYFYGASSDAERNRMPTYLLQLEAMRLAASRGCIAYDLWGIPDFDEAYLEENFMSRSDGLWGVYRFKRGFGGKIKRSAGVFQRVLNPAFYRLYQGALKIRKTTLS